MSDPGRPRHFSKALLILLLLAAPQRGWPAPGAPFTPTRAPVPPPECQAHGGYDRDTMLPGYLLPTSLGPKTCIPFTTVAAHPPQGYQGDFYVDEFTDAKLRERWEACKADKDCYQRVQKQVAERHPPNREYLFTDPRALYLLGKIEEKGADTDLKSIRRPAFFARAPYHEPIAQDESRTYTVEFTAPAEPYERLQKNMTANIRLRGWYIRGGGVPDGKGNRHRALVILSGGGGDRVVAIDDPSDHLFHIEKDGTSELNKFPNETTGAKGQALWRSMDHVLNQTGFDVLNFDRRGVGISGGYSDTNTLQQGRDLLGIIAALRSGDGMRALAPTGEVLTGRDAAAAVRARDTSSGLPVLSLGSSRGPMSSSWAMTMNFDKDCSYDLPVISCNPPVGDPTIKGAILISEFSSGVGYNQANPSKEDNERGLGRDRGLFIAGTELENNLVFFPSSAILAGIHKWPSAFFARGLWCYAASLEGTMDSYSRVNGLKELVVVRAPHPYETWPEEEKQRTQARLVAFAKAAIPYRRISGVARFSYDILPLEGALYL